VENLRLILILLGIIILAAIVLFHKPQGETRRNHQRWLSGRREPHLGTPDSDEPDPPATGRDRDIPASTANLAAGLASARMLAREEDGEHRSEHSEPTQRVHSRAAPEKIISLFVQRKDDRPIKGTELLDAASRAGLDFGEMNIFHRLHEGASDPVFSVANLTAPGHFDPASWDRFDTPGLTFFATLPGPVSALDAWDAMLATARRMGELLDADVLDDSRCLISRQRIAQMREDAREYDRRHGLGKAD
jgi:cell division protein ZipA